MNRGATCHRRRRMAVWQSIGLALLLVPAAAFVFAQARADFVAIPPRVDDCTKAGCHQDFKKKKVVHGAACEGCHEATDEEKHKFKLTANEPDMCTECHDEVTEDLEFEHGPVAAGQCTVCHDPHASDHAKLLTAAGPSLCTECHEELGERLEEGKHKHGPAAQGCVSCHRPHGGDNAMLLTHKLPKLCTECHEDVADAIEDATVKHSAATLKPCTYCHDPHVSAASHLLRADSKTLCLSCHAKPIKVGKRVIAGVGELLEKRKNHHGPIAKNDCTACHRGAHGSDTPHHLTGNYPGRLYAAFDAKTYSLCFECHDSEMVEEEQDEDVTAFRNGERNLHYLHVNKTKGRSCRACHDVHASSGPALIRESIPFGKTGWRLPIRFKQSETGGSCQPGCHKAYAYDREKPVVNLPK